MTISTSALAQLPHDENVSHLITVTEDYSSPDDPISSRGTTEVSENDSLTYTDTVAEDTSYDNDLSWSFVPWLHPQ